jgi:threonine synthase
MSTLVCRRTGRRYSSDEPIWCSAGGGLLDLEFTPQFDRARIAQRPPTMWRYREALPIRHDEAIVTFGEGYTPLLPADLGGRTIWLKLEYLFPTASYKDRGASVLISKARELGVARVVEDSSGNAGAGGGGLLRPRGMACESSCGVTFRPKLAQIPHTRATLCAVEGSRRDKRHAALRRPVPATTPSHVWNPYFFHGTKTFAYEVVEQMGWRPPDAVVIPTGNGTLLCGAYLGFCELRAAGFIDRLPRLVAVQAERCAPLHAAWRGGAAPAPSAVAEDTLAEGIAIAEPLRAEQCVAAVRETGGELVTVPEAELVAAWRQMLRMGLCIEPTSATAVAALAHCELSGNVVVPLTGHGLKAAGKLAAFQ